MGTGGRLTIGASNRASVNTIATFCHRSHGIAIVIIKQTLRRTLSFANLALMHSH